MEEEKETNQKDSKSPNIKAKVFVSIDTNADGGKLRTKIYCFQTNYPIVEMA